MADVTITFAAESDAAKRRVEELQQELAEFIALVRDGATFEFNVPAENALKKIRQLRGEISEINRSLKDFAAAEADAAAKAANAAAATAQQAADTEKLQAALNKLESRSVAEEQERLALAHRRAAGAARAAAEAAAQQAADTAKLQAVLARMESRTAAEEQDRLALAHRRAAGAAAAVTAAEERRAAAVQKLGTELRAAVGAADREFEAQKRSEEQAKKTAAAHSSQANVMRRLTQLVQLYLASLAIRTIRNFASAVIDSTVAMERYENILELATGSTEEAGKRIDFVRGLVDKMGADFQSTTEGISRFEIAARDAGLTTEQTLGAFEGVSTALTVLQADAETSAGVFQALEQIMSKGKLTSEELRRQLGNRLPGAFNLMAKGLGVTTEELEKMLRDGAVPAKDAIIALGEAATESFGPGLQQAAGSLRAEMNRLKSASFEASASIGETFRPEVTRLTVAMRQAAEATEAFLGSQDAVSEKLKQLTGVTFFTNAVSKLASEMKLLSLGSEDSTLILLRWVQSAEEFARTADLAAKSTEELTEGARGAEVGVLRLEGATERFSAAQVESELATDKNLKALERNLKASTKFLDLRDKMSETLGITADGIEEEAGAFTRLVNAHWDLIDSNSRVRQSVIEMAQEFVERFQEIGQRAPDLIASIAAQMDTLSASLEKIGVESSDSILESVNALREYDAAITNSGVVTQSQADLIVEAAKKALESIGELPASMRDSMGGVISDLESLITRYSSFTAESVEKAREAVEEQLDLIKDAREEIQEEIDLINEALSTGFAAEGLDSGDLISEAKRLKKEIEASQGAPRLSISEDNELIENRDRLTKIEAELVKRREMLVEADQEAIASADDLTSAADGTAKAFSGGAKPISLWVGRVEDASSIARDLGDDFDRIDGNIKGFGESVTNAGADASFMGTAVEGLAIELAGVNRNTDEVARAVEGFRERQDEFNASVSETNVAYQTAAEATAEWQDAQKSAAVVAADTRTEQEKLAETANQIGAGFSTANTSFQLLVQNVNSDGPALLKFFQALKECIASTGV